MKRRHPDNTHLTYHHSGPWAGYDVQLQRGPLFIPYLKRIHETMHRAIDRQARTMGIRVDLMMPANGYARPGDWLGLFIHSLRAQVEADMIKRKREGRRAPACRIDYISVEEQVGNGQVHYHVCLFLNGECYRGLGEMPTGRGSGQADFDPDVPTDPRAEQADSLAKKIVMAWARALGLTMGQTVGLVHFPNAGVYWVKRNSVLRDSQTAGLFNRLSYLAKAQSKHFGKGRRSIRYSRT